jgi:hypothetical protein
LSSISPSLRTRFAQITRPIRNARYRAWCWLRRKIRNTPQVEMRTLLEIAPQNGCRIERVFWKDRPPIILPVPKSLGDGQDRFFTSRQSIPVFDRYLARLEGACIDADDGFLFLPDGRVLAENHFFFRDYVENHRCMFWRRPPPQRVHGPVFSLTGFCPGGHYHAMTDMLYRLYGCIDFLPGETRFLLPQQASTVHRAALATLGVPPERCFEIKEGDYLQFDDLWYAPPVTKSGFDLPEVTRWVRERFHAQVLGRPVRHAAPPTRKLYITRRSAYSRRVVNESELQSACERFGYETIECEKLPLAEQFALFSEASHVVGPHGAGLVNLFFAPPGGRLLELFPHEMPEGGTCYWSLANAVGWDYTYVQSGIAGISNNDIEAPIKAISAWMEANDQDNAVFDQRGARPTRG